jgi:hypothetical protein
MKTLPLAESRGMFVRMNRPKKVLPFPPPAEEPLASTIIVQIGNDRFAIHWKIEELPPASPLVARKRRTQKATVKILK